MTDGGAGAQRAPAAATSGICGGARPRVCGFRGIRYDPAKVDAPEVVAPPYDIIDENYRDRLLSRSPFNLTHLVLGRDLAADDDCENRYTRAGRLWKRWIAEGVLLREQRPSLYIYCQTFTSEGRRFKRTGLIGAVRLEAPGAGRTFPHEKTMSRPREDRLRLIVQTRANLSPVFAVCADDDGAARAAFAQARGTEVVRVTDDLGVENVLLRVDDPREMARLAAAVEDRALVIADGHHRYETALAFHEELTAAGQADQWSPSALVMMTCVPMSDPGLVVLPAHRLLKTETPLTREALEGLVGRDFELSDVEDDSHDLGGLKDHVAGSPAHSFGIYLGGGRGVLACLRKDETPQRLEEARLAGILLDTVVLRRFLLLPILGDCPNPDDRIHYEADRAVVREAVDSGGAGAGFILAPTPLEAVRRIASAGLRMPPKSTYFFPKLMGGLVMRDLEKD